MTAFYIVIWVACGIVEAGFHNAYERTSWPRLYLEPREARDSQRWCLGSGIIAGPIGLLVTLLIGLCWDGWTLTGKPIDTSARDAGAK
jgi:hypothetical protein